MWRAAGLKGQKRERKEYNFVCHKGDLNASLGVNVEEFALDRAIPDVAHAGRHVPADAVYKQGRSDSTS